MPRTMNAKGNGNEGYEQALQGCVELKERSAELMKFIRDLDDAPTEKVFKKYVQLMSDVEDVLQDISDGMDEWLEAA